MPVRVAHLSSVHPADDVRIFHRECASLAAGGFDVSLVVPNEGELPGPVRIHPLPCPASRLRRMTVTQIQVLGAALKQRADLYHFHDVELIPTGLALKLCGKRVVYDVHEDVPRDLLTREYLPRVVMRILARTAERVEAIAARIFDGIVAATPAIGARFPESKTVVVNNYPPVDECVSDHARRYPDRSNVIAVAGILGRIRAVREMVGAMELLPDRLQARLRVAGTFSSPEFESEMKAMPGSAHVDWLGWQSRAQVAHLLGEARIAMCLYHPTPNHMNALPTKLFEAMSAALPVVAPNFSLLAEFVSGQRIGLVVDPLDPRAVAAAITWLLDHPEEAKAMGERGRAAVQERLNWAMEFEKLRGLYRMVLPADLHPAAAPSDCAATAARSGS